MRPSPQEEEGMYREINENHVRTQKSKQNLEKDPGDKALNEVPGHYSAERKKMFRNQNITLDDGYPTEKDN